MIKSGLLFGAGMFLLVLLASVFASPFCALCVAVLMGLGAGYVAGAFDKPVSSPEATRKGAVAGAITGGMSILAQMLASVISAVLYQTNRSYYVSLCPNTQLPDPSAYWVIQLLMGCCLAVVNVALSAGLGVAGGAIWFSTSGKKHAPPAQPAP